MRLEVNADDLGMTRRINDEAFDLIARGYVNSCSVIVNAPFASEAIQKARAFPNVRFGIHLNVADFAPLNATAGLEPLLQANGHFAGNILWRQKKTKSLARAIYCEWSAQIDRCIQLGLRPDHIDSHCDAHLVPEFIPIVQRLQRRYAITRVRRNHNFGNAAGTLRQRIRGALWTALFTATGARVPHYVMSLGDFRRAVHRGWPNSRLALRDVRVEIIVHPGNDYCSQFTEETELLRSGWIEQFRNKDCQFVSQPKRSPPRMMEALPPEVT